MDAHDHPHAHGREQGHDKGHAKGHDHAHAARGGRLVAVLAITLVVLAVQLLAAWRSGSLALLADSAHVAVDAAGLVLAVVADRLARRPATARHTWGLRRAEVLAAGAQATLLLGVGMFVLWEGVARLVHPEPVTSGLMLAAAAVGLAGNLAGVALLLGDRGANLSVRGAFLDLASDALGSVAVLTAAAVIAATGWTRADALASLAVVALIVPRTLALLRDSVAVLLEATPAGLDLTEVRSHLLALPHVLDVHDVHASLVATGLPVLTAHVVVDDACFLDGHVPTLLDAVQACLALDFDVEHSTFQFEPAAHASHERGTHG
ncbi:MAG: cation diffusion facilitator family transporter [Kineosporiaceae bacterium]